VCRASAQPDWSTLRLPSRVHLPAQRLGSPSLVHPRTASRRRSARTEGAARRTRARRARSSAAETGHAVAVPGAPRRSHETCTTDTPESGTRPSSPPDSAAREEKGKPRAARRIYDLRHTYATFSLAAGGSLFTPSRRMGPSVEMIDGTYGHLAPDARGLRARPSGRLRQRNSNLEARIGH
jgi:hypothetical protein